MGLGAKFKLFCTFRGWSRISRSVFSPSWLLTCRWSLTQFRHILTHYQYSVKGQWSGFCPVWVWLQLQKGSCQLTHIFWKNNVVVSHPRTNAAYCSFNFNSGGSSILPFSKWEKTKFGLRPEPFVLHIPMHPNANFYLVITWCLHIQHCKNRAPDSVILELSKYFQ